MVALNKSFALENPAPGSKNRVGDFFGRVGDRAGENRPATRNRIGENQPTLTIIASGRPYWPSRDPIGAPGSVSWFDTYSELQELSRELGILFSLSDEPFHSIAFASSETLGGLNLYGFVLNAPSNYWDLLGMALPQAGYRPIDGSDWMGPFAILWHAFIKFSDGTTDSNLGGEGGGTSRHTRYVNGVKVTDADATLEDGTPCPCASDEDIEDCVRNSISTCSSAGYPFSNNCGSNVRDAFTSCCLEDPTPWWLWYPGGNN